ncbi:hypothetical protein E3X62_19630 [Shigella sonnei]|nr:hypothetical protein [Shigella sonnei]
MQNLPSCGRKLVILTCSPFGTVETDRASLSCIVMQAPENDSDAFSYLGEGFYVHIHFFASDCVLGRFMRGF